MKKLLMSAALGAVALVSVEADAVELLTNGDFETGSLAGWTVSDIAPGGGPASGGMWSAAPNTGAFSPLASLLTPINPVGGTTFAVADQTDPSAQSLTQGFMVPVGTTSVTFSFDMFFDDYSLASPTGAAAGFVFGTAGGAQFARIDILTATAAAFSTAPADVVEEILVPVPPPAFLPGTNPWIPSPLFDLTGILAPGGSYQVRFALIQEFAEQIIGVDNVSVMATVGTPPGRIPEPGMLVLFGLGLAGIGFAARRRR